ncbi:hypothetical protein I79_005548 [Cricetulus griseus]|uniref:Uncharacterized protein n=1 Tax=Cricetulus griseus TaxID=10029 RepID=G3H5G7_CRIGR|nr:hypothetical protein I79_005548 [Cricetulus griseus]
MFVYSYICNTQLRLEEHQNPKNRSDSCLRTATWVMETELRPLQGCCSSPRNLFCNSVFYKYI